VCKVGCGKQQRERSAQFRQIRNCRNSCTYN
ncbi:MAG: hypothetical protein EZS28_046637, partial [Streblomastix strix]